MKIIDILAMIDAKQYALPEFQRGYVWSREQVKKLATSLYRGYPIGGLLIWTAEADESYTRGDFDRANKSVKLILDGQQRITTLYGLIRGKAPSFFEGDERAFKNLYFNVETEVFEFYAPIKMKDDKTWIDVTQLLKNNVGSLMGEADIAFYGKYFERINKLWVNFTQKEMHLDDVVGEDKTLDVVVEIFNNLNSGGTKLSKGDLALAKICALWPEARQELRAILSRLKEAGYEFKLEWLLRCVTVDITSKAYFSELEHVDIENVKKGLKHTENKIDEILNQIGSRLGLDNTRVLASKFAIPLMIGYLNKENRELSDKEWNKLLYWYIHTFLWGRYAGSTESVLAKDLNVINEGKGVDGLISLLRQERADLTLKPDDFWGWGTGARFYPLLYLMTRVNKSRDFSSGIELKNNLLGKSSSLEIHHIFPKALLYKNGRTKPVVNSLANYTFITRKTNEDISDKKPEEYIPIYMSAQPGAIESHWIPTNDAELYKIENYEKFLARRRELLAESGNNFLNSLLNDEIEKITIEDYANRKGVSNLVNEDETILELSYWMEENGFPGGEINYQMKSNDDVVIIDLAWPDGIQKGLTEPIAIMIDEDDESINKVNLQKYRIFENVDAFKEYVRSNYLEEI